MNNRRTCLGPCGLLLCVAALSACSGPAAGPAATPVPRPASLIFQAPEVLSGPGTGFATVMAAASPTGEQTIVWSAAPPGDGTLYFRITGRTSDPAGTALPDLDGAAGMDPETPAKVAYGANGELYVAYSITEPPQPSKHSGSAAAADPGTALRVIRSEDRGKTWSAPVNIADDGPWGAYRNDHAFHVAANGHLFAAWLDGRNPTGERVYFSRSLDRGASWSKNIAVDPGTPCECCRVALASSAPDTVYVAWRKILPGGIRDIVVAHSIDGGATWSAPVLTHADDWKIDGCPDAGPALLAEPDGRLHLLWWTGKEGAAGVNYVSSADGGRTWGAALPLKVGTASRPSHPQLARAPDGTLYAAWDDGLSAQPQIVLAVSHDGGHSFDEPLVISEPGAAAVFPSLAVTKQALTVVWHQPDPKQDSVHQVVARTARLP